MSYGPNSEWPPKSKMATRKFNNYTSATKLTQAYTFMEKIWDFEIDNSNMLLFFMSYDPNSKWHLKLRCPSKPESFNLYHKLT